jgi:signal transduction histidine kinase
MVLQAGAAQAELPSSANGAVRGRLEVIESSGREALDELRRILAVTQSDGDSATAPAPGLADLTSLVKRTAASGLEIDLTVDVNSALSPGLALSVYRIVQEALTNVLKHASATRAWVRVDERQGEIAVEVGDDGRGSESRSLAGSGRGLVGMRERAAMFGGTVSATLEPGRGFVVAARLPLEGRQ